MLKLTYKREQKQEKNEYKDRKGYHKLIDNAAYGKTMETLRNRPDVRLVSNKKNYSKQISKPSQSHKKIFDGDLVVIHNSKITLILSKPA